MMGRCAYGGLEKARKDHLSHDMGMHNEGPLGRTMERFFILRRKVASFRYPDAPDVDFNKRAEFDAQNSKLNRSMRKFGSFSPRRWDGGFAQSWLKAFASQSASCIGSTCILKVAWDISGAD